MCKFSFDVADVMDLVCLSTTEVITSNLKMKIKLKILVNFDILQFFELFSTVIIVIQEKNVKEMKFYGF